LIPPVSDATRQAIEAILTDRWPGEWRPARDGEAIPAGESSSACWRLDASPGEHGHANVTFVWLCVDGDFPLSRMRIFAPGVSDPGAQVWPHVEDRERLCLGPLPLDIQSHVRYAVQDAFAILGMDEAARASEFAREFIAYWNRHVGSTPEARSLISPGGLSRPIVWVPWGKSFMFAEDSAAIEHWLAQGGYKLASIRPTRLIRLDHAPAPGAYPTTGADIFGLDPLVRDLCQTRDPVPILLEVPTSGSAVQVAVVIQPRDVVGLPKNRRYSVRVGRRDAVFGAAPVSRMAVMRQDHAWVHGRDHNKDAALLAQRCVGFVGCGALGSEVARLLAAAGVGQFVFVDKDQLESANTTRHALGATAVGHRKATALGESIGRQFPHLAKAVTHPLAFERLGPRALDDLAGCDLLLGAGVDALTVIRMARWRDRLDAPPPLVIAWVEEFACAGHAMLLSPGLTAGAFLDDSGRPKANLTRNWPTAATNVVPAGCGSAFQPYTATDMLGTVQMTTRLILEALLGVAHAPMHRVWLGDRRVAEQHGATIAPAFDGAFKETDAP
jgi:hypothetical protein